MKRIEEIENLSVEELEKISEDLTIPVPEGLEERIHLPSGRVLGLSTRWWIGVAASLVLVAGAAVTLRPKPLRGTFDDPALAYAAIEDALAKVRPGIEIGVKAVEKGEDLLLKPDEIMNTINNR